MARRRDDYRDLRLAVAEFIARVEGKPCVNVCRDGSVFVCRRIYQLRVDEDSLDGECEWVDPPSARPEELTDGLSIGISPSLIRIGPDWWHDEYFHWYFVFDPVLVARSVAGEHSWVPEFLKSVTQ
jgi:hypothetical protein